MRRDVVSPEGFRIDGRRPRELRRVACHIGPAAASASIGASADSGAASAVSALGLADGVAFVEHGHTKCLVRVFGPREPASSSSSAAASTVGAAGAGAGESAVSAASSSSSEANLVVDFSIAAFSSGERKQRLRKDKRLLEMASLIKTTFESAVILSASPRSEIAVFVHILQFDGGLLHAAVNATSLALMNAGIPMLDYVVACSAGFANGCALLDANLTEEGMDVPVVTLGMMPRDGKVVLVNLESRLHIDEFEGVVALAKDGCAQMYTILDAAVRASAQEFLER